MVDGAYRIQLTGDLAAVETTRYSGGISAEADQSESANKAMTMVFAVLQKGLPHPLGTCFQI